MAYYIVFFISAFISLILNNKGKSIALVILIFILTFFAGTRLDVDNDYHMYYKSLLYMEKSLKDFQNREIPIELTMYLFPKFFEFIFNNKVAIVRSVFFSYALIGVTTKLVSIKKTSDFFFLSVILYTSNLFFMMEMTTIRAGVAAGIFLLSIKCLEEKNNKKFILLLILAYLFHSSSILFLIPWLLLKIKFNIRYYYIFIIVGFLSALFKINILTILFLDKIFPRVDIYIKAMEWMKEKDTNIFNFKIIFALLLIVIFAFYYKKMKEIKYFDVLFKIHLISVSLFFMLSTSAQVFSIRTFELFSVVQIILYPMIIHVFHPKFKILGWLMIIIFSFIQLYYIISVADIYQTYKSWFF